MKTEFINRQVTNDLQVILIPDVEHEFLMTSKEVAKGYGIHQDTLRTHKRRNKEDLIEGKHFLSSVSVGHGASPGASLTTLWTKRGVIRLGFIIESNRARLFRDWVEDLVINVIEQKLPNLPDSPRRQHNRLTPERLIDILHDVCRIEDSQLRISISEKLLAGSSLK